MPPYKLILYLLSWKYGLKFGGTKEEFMNSINPKSKDCIAAAKEIMSLLRPKEK